MEDTTSRLRKTFRYPTDNDSEDSSPEALDEEEQENLILSLHEKNTAQNKLYTRFLLLLPILSLVPYTLTLFHSSTPTPHLPLLSILSLTSLLCTTYLLLAFPPEVTGLPFLDSLHTSTSPAPSNISSRKRGLVTGGGGGEGPIKTYLPYLNMALCAILMVLGWVMGVRGANGERWLGFGWLPGGVYGVVVGAKFVMGGVDPEGELGGLRYGYKGA